MSRSKTSHYKNKTFAEVWVGWLKRLMKEDVGLVYTTLGGLGSTLLGAFFWFILASILEVKNYGLVNYYIALASIFAGLGTMGLNTTITTYLAKGERNLLYEANSLTLISGLLSATSKCKNPEIVSNKAFRVYVNRNPCFACFEHL